MTVLINNETHAATADTSLFHILKKIKMEERKGIAVAVNNAIVPRTNWNQYALKENDAITIIEASQGG
jgi:sulfur carrier protein